MSDQISEDIRTEYILEGKKGGTPNRKGKVVIDKITEVIIAQITEDASDLFFLSPALNTVSGIELIIIAL